MQKAPQKQAALCAKSISVSWDNKVIVQNVSLEVFPGEIVGLIGKSGCGKTSLLHALAGLVAPTAGAVTIEGSDHTARPGAASYMFQKDLLIPSKTVIDNVCLPRVIAGVAPAQARQEATDFFKIFGLDGTQELWPYQLSGGMKQRAALLRTYMMGNRVVLLDEPFSALDALTRTELREWYRAMARKLGLASLIVTHDVDEALVLADRIYVLHTGGASGENGGAIDAGNPAHAPAHISYELRVERPCERGVLDLDAPADMVTELDTCPSASEQVSVSANTSANATLAESFSLTPRFLQYKKQLLEQLA